MTYFTSMDHEAKLALFTLTNSGVPYNNTFLHIESIRVEVDVVRREATRMEVNGVEAEPTRVLNLLFHAATVNSHVKIHGMAQHAFHKGKSTVPLLLWIHRAEIFTKAINLAVIIDSSFYMYYEEENGNAPLMQHGFTATAIDPDHGQRLQQLAPYSCSASSLLQARTLLFRHLRHSEDSQRIQNAEAYFLSSILYSVDH